MYAIVVSIGVMITPSGNSTAGQTYSLDCSVTGTSDPATYRWFEGPADNRTALTGDASRVISSNPTSSQLQFSTLLASHTGTYTCQASIENVIVEGTQTVVVNCKLQYHVVVIIHKYIHDFVFYFS